MEVRSVEAMFRALNEAEVKYLIVGGEIPPPVVAYETLLAMKKDAGREKDLLDIAALKKLDPYR